MDCNLQNPACVKSKEQMTQFLQRANCKGKKRHKNLELAIVEEGWFLTILIPLYALPKGAHEFPCHTGFGSKY